MSDEESLSIAAECLADLREPGGCRDATQPSEFWAAVRTAGTANTCGGGVAVAASKAAFIVRDPPCCGPDLSIEDPSASAQSVDRTADFLASARLYVVGVHRGDIVVRAMAPTARPVHG